MKKFFLLLIILAIRPFFYFLYADSCSAGKTPIYFISDSSITADISPVFSEEIKKELTNSLFEIGYCLQNPDSGSLSDTSKYENLIIYLTCQKINATSIIDSFNLLVCLIRVEDWVHKTIDLSLEHPLVTLLYEPEEIETFKAVLVRKIIENIRTQYVCHLKIQSSPGDVYISSESGLAGKTPLEWIIPSGTIHITGKKDGYETIHKTIDLAEPGVHTYYLQLKKKQFYKSKFIYPAIVFTLSSIAFYGLENYYYNGKYQKLGINDYKNHPERFERTFATAQNFEKASIASLACAVVSFSLSFALK